MSIVKDYYDIESLLIPQDRLLNLHYVLWDNIIKMCEKSEFNKIEDKVYYIRHMKYKPLEYILENEMINKEEFDCVYDSGCCFMCAYILNNDNGEDIGRLSNSCKFCDRYIEANGYSRINGCLGGIYEKLFFENDFDKFIEICEIIRDFFVEE